MHDFEKMGVFYLGKELDSETKQLSDNLVLMQSKDLTTHAMIIGMTGSGKTGLGISMIEEAALDQIPVIAIDPKGDLANLALTFPQLRQADFEPWINLSEASNKGLSKEEFALNQAEQWKKGLASWGQSGERIQKFKDAAQVKVYTPGSSAGLSVSLLKSFNPPPQVILEDHDAYRERLDVTATSILSLIGVNAQTLTSREHILISNILDHAWQQHQALTLSDLIIMIQTPPMKQVGVLDLESFYPTKDRLTLAMQLNNVLASPSFKSWLEGEALDIQHFLYNSSGKPCVSVFSIAHLSDSERMFFVTMLLNEVISWMRSQPGTGSLRAMLYMDELFGFLPPVANPPSKTPLLTLLKQARAYGLGLVLSTQNPVDLDYKALSNTGTWLIGRLQTQRDIERLIAGLEGLASDQPFNRSQTERLIAGLSQRQFYLHSVHEANPTLFSTRWVLSYLAGPMTRDQIASLNQTQSTTQHAFQPQKTTQSSSQPILSAQIPQVYCPPQHYSTSSLTYEPYCLGVGDVFYQSAKHNVSLNQNVVFLAPIHDGVISVDWSEAKKVNLSLKDISRQKPDNAVFEVYPEAASNPKNYDLWEKSLNQFIRTNVSLKLFYSPKLKLLSHVSEDQRDFVIRLQHAAHEARDEAIEALKKKYATRINTLEDRLRRAQQAVEKQSTLANQKKMDAMVSTGTAIFSALFGSKKISATSITRVGSAMKSSSKALKSGQGIEQAQETLESVQNQLQELSQELENHVLKISDDYDVTTDHLEEVEIRATSNNISIPLVALAWVPKE
ncbi:MAG: DUF87 domain-containing protein [Erysipelothrix sp.]|nr:DUF87 domain-containing protein [Erysipelothrix sp.]